jgi:hypothetical protein
LQLILILIVQNSSDLNDLSLHLSILNPYLLNRAAPEVDYKHRVLILCLPRVFGSPADHEHFIRLICLRSLVLLNRFTTVIVIALNDLVLGLHHLLVQTLDELDSFDRSELIRAPPLLSVIVFYDLNEQNARDWRFQHH